MLNMFRTLIYPSSGACDCVAKLPHRSSCSRFVVCWSFQASACKTNTTQNQPHQSSNTQRTENKTTDVVIQQHSRKLLMMDILMSETCWAHKKSNKIASDIKLVFHSSNITMMHGPINIRVTFPYLPVTFTLFLFFWLFNLKMLRAFQNCSCCAVAQLHSVLTRF